MSDYGSMITRIADELGDPAVVARIPKAIQAAVRYYESERLWFNEGEATASTVIGQQAYATPTDFLEMDTLSVTDSGIRYMMTRRSWPWLRHHQLDTDAKSRPDNWAYYADQLWLYPIPDQVYTLTSSYLKRFAALSAYADTNDWMTHGEELTRSRAKWDLLLHTAKDYQGALAMKQAEDDALFNLRAKSEQKVSTGKLSFDDGLLTSRDSYNINYQ